MMPYFVRDDVGLREVAARFVFIRKFVEKAEIQINFMVPRAIKRSRLRTCKAETKASLSCSCGLSVGSLCVLAPPSKSAKGL